MNLETRMGLLIVKVAHALCDPRITGPDGPSGVYGFCPDGDDGPGCVFGDNELEAAINFLESQYP